jgi:hypothetical protein
MLLILRPTYEFMSELTGFLSTSWSDYNGISSMIGNDLIWLYIIFSLALSLGSVLVILRRFVGFPEKKNIQVNVQYKDKWRLTRRSSSASPEE